MQEAWHTLKINEIFQKLSTSRQGLTKEQAEARLKKYGPNELVREEGISPLKIFINQFKSALVLLLIVAIGISVFIGAIIDAYVIGAIVIINAFLGFFQEYKAERAIEMLKKLSPQMVTVIRNGEKIRIPAKNLVPGDIIFLNEGDKVAADARLIQAVSLSVNEAPLTGESAPVSKDMGVIKKEHVSISECKNMVFMNTTVIRGRGLAVVVATGMNTQVGNIAKMISGTQTPQTPLQKKLDAVGKSIGVAVVILAGLVFAFGVLRGHIGIFNALITSIALAVAAVPEGLPAVVTITLAVGLSRLAKSKSLIRRLPVVETLGSATVICADKTGTLTKGEMTITEIFLNNQTIKVTGSGYEPIGEFLIKGRKIEPKKDKHLSLLLTAGALCTTAELKQNNHWEIFGDTTEGAIIVAAQKAGFVKHELKREYNWLGEIPFDSKRKLMSAVYKSPANKKIAFVKGAPEILIERCTYIFEENKIRALKKGEKEKLFKINANMAKRALRVLAIAYKIVPDKIKHYSSENIERDLVFLGLVGMLDPPRKEAKEAVRLCQQAGIKVVMITGDNELTAKAIATELGVLKEKELSLTGAELDKLSQEEFSKLVNRISVYARVSPEHKLRIVEALQKQNQVVAMTGDGVNDAPALKKADIGVAMGITGTDVAKEASDMILEDDNFATIVNAVREGRGIYENIRSFIRYLLSSNVGEVLTIFAATLIGLPLPLIAVQILWMNLLTDGLPALALGLDPPEKDIMRRKPRDPSKPTIDKDMWIFILLVGLVATAGTVAMFWRALPNGLEHARTMAFTTMVMFQMANVFNSRSDKSIFKDRRVNKWLLLAIGLSILLQLIVIYIPYLQSLFGTTALGLIDWFIIIGISLFVVFVVELKKAISKLYK